MAWMSRKKASLKLALGAMQLAAVATVMGLAAQEAQAARPKVAVIFGDSFASGEGGRWKGNSWTSDDWGNNSGTDQSWTGSQSRITDESYEYYSYQSGCNRSLNSPITYLGQNGGEPLYDLVKNYACSGAQTKNVKRFEEGGVPEKDTLTQLDAFELSATQFDVKLVAIGVGGNDMGFSDAIMVCLLKYFAKHATTSDDAGCKDFLRDGILPKLYEVQHNVRATIGSVRARMAALGHNDYKIVLMGAPAIIPGFSSWAYSEGDRFARGCPIIGDDSAFVANVLMPKLNATLEAAAHQAGVDFLSTERALEGHRLCEAGTYRPTTTEWDAPEPLEYGVEWVRRIDKGWPTIGQAQDFINGRSDEPNYPVDQGTLQESFHPNFYGQKAIGHCLRQYALDTAASPKRLTCSNGYSRVASHMVLEELAAPKALIASPDQTIPDYGVLDITRTLSPNAEPGQVMRTEIKISHPRKGQLRIRLIDPNGREYVVKDVNPADSGAFPSLWNTFHYDAPAVPGNWTLRIVDTVTGQTGTFLDWRAYFY